MSAVHGLPERLPSGERLLWQGSPDWRVLARRSFHVRKLAAYLAVVVLSVVATGGSLASVLLAAGLAAVPPALVLAYAWAVGRTTVYTVTDRRVVLRAGIALPVSVNLPLARVASAGMVARADGSGDIPLALTPGAGLAYFMLWPHARPWRIARAEPMLRGLKAVQPVAQVLARALAASADMAAPVLPGAVAGQGAAAPVPVAA